MGFRNTIATWLGITGSTSIIPINPNKLLSDAISNAITQRNEWADSLTSPRSKVTKQVKGKGLFYRSTRRTREYLTPEYDMSIVAAFYDNEAYVTQSINKYLEQIVKRGFNIVGSDQKTVDIVNSRVRDIEYATGVGLNVLIREMAHQILLFGNAFIYKRRNEKLSTGLPYKKFPKDNTLLDPICGLFVEDTTTIRISADEKGKPKKYTQLLEGLKDPIHARSQFSFGSLIPFRTQVTREPTWTPKEMDHITYNKRPGLTWAMPPMYPAIGDIKALRMIEENIELLIYQYGTSILHVKVGTPDHPAQEAEIAWARDEIDSMEGNGSIVTNHRYEIQHVGIEGQALRAEDYLQYFKRRVFTGLGASEVLMGESNTSNKGTAVTIDKSSQTRVRDIQGIIENYITNKIFTEFLYEAGIKYWNISPKNKVHLTFPEVDLERKSVLENAAIQLWLSDGLTFNEYRERLGLPPVDERGDKFFSDIQKEITDEQTKQQLEGQIQLAKSKAQPTNQQGRKAGKTEKKNDLSLEDLLRDN